MTTDAREMLLIIIEDNPSKFKAKDLNYALKWAGKSPKDYKGKREKMEAMLNYLKYEYKK